MNGRPTPMLLTLLVLALALPAGTALLRSPAGDAAKPARSDQAEVSAAHLSDVLQLYQEFFGLPVAEQGSETVALIKQPTKAAGYSSQYLLLGKPDQPPPPAGVAPSDPFQQIARQAAARGYQLEFVVALVPDPLDSNLSAKFDEAMQGIQEAYASMSYLLDRMWLPWSDDAAVASYRYRQAPGAILFRSGSPVSGEKQRLAAVLLVGETPKLGIHRQAFRRALELIAGLQGATGGNPPNAQVRILGPSFSGSAESLRIALSDWSDHEKESTTQGAAPASPAALAIPAVPPPPTTTVAKSGATGAGNGLRFTIASGSATARALQSYFYPLDNVDDFCRSVVPDQFLLPATLEFLAGRLGWDMRRVAILREADTAYGQDFGDFREGDYFHSIPAPAQLTFPIGLSGYRTQFEEAGGFQPASEKGQSGQVQAPPTSLDVSLADHSHPVDTVREMSSLTAGNKQLVISNILATISRDDIRYVGIFASDLRDQLFLAKLIRLFCPDVVLFTLDNNLLDAHPQYTDATNGMLVLSSYPLLTEGRDWQRWLGGPIWSEQAEQDSGFPFRFQRQFGGELEEGVYHALLHLLLVSGLPAGAPGAARASSSPGGTAATTADTAPAGAAVPPDLRSPSDRQLMMMAEALGREGPQAWIDAVGAGSLWPIARLPIRGESGDGGEPAWPGGQAASAGRSGTRQGKIVRGGAPGQPGQPSSQAALGDLFPEGRPPSWSCASRAYDVFQAAGWITPASGASAAQAGSPPARAGGSAAPLPAPAAAASAFSASPGLPAGSAAAFAPAAPSGQVAGVAGGAGQDAGSAISRLARFAGALASPRLLRREDLPLILGLCVFVALAVWLWRDSGGRSVLSAPEDAPGNAITLLATGWGALWLVAGVLLVIATLEPQLPAAAQVPELAALGVSYATLLCFATFPRSPRRRRKLPSRGAAPLPLAIHDEKPAGGALSGAAGPAGPLAASWRFWSERLPVLAQAVAGLALLASLPYLLRWLWMPGGADLFMLRARQYWSGLSPVSTLLLEAGALFSWVLFEQKRRLLRLRQGVSWPLRRPCLPALLHCRSLARPVQRLMDRALPHRPRFWVLLAVLVGVPGLFLLLEMQPIAETRAYGKLFVAFTSLVFSLCVISFYRFVALWLTLERILARIDQTKLLDALAAVSAEVSWKPMKSFSWQLPPFKMLTLSAARLKAIANGATRRCVDEILGEIFLAERSGDLRAEMLARARLNRLFNAAAREVSGCGEGAGDAYQAFLAVRVVAYLRYVFAHMRNCLAGTMVAGLFLLGAVHGYAFEPKRLAGLGLYFALLAAIVITVWIFVQMDRNATLSAIGGTPGGEVTLDRHFVSGVLTYGAVPLLGLLATQFPQVGRLFGGWLNPILRLVGSG